MELLKLVNINKTFTLEKGLFGKSALSVKAVNGVSLSLNKGGFTAILGESGSGKTTLGRMICGLTKPDNGSVTIDGKDIGSYTRYELSRKVQMIFQDPFASLNPKLSIRTTLSEALLPGKDSGEIENTLTMVGLSTEALALYPHHFSGGQRQRIAIARALLKKPELIIADEPLSSLDISIQAQILELFMKLRDSGSVSFIFISHDIVAASNVADYFYIMKDGSVVEEGPAAKILSSPGTLYTQTLLNAVPQ